MKSTAIALLAGISLTAWGAPPAPTVPPKPAGPVVMPYPNGAAAASADAFDIPPQLLAQEARVRAGLDAPARVRVAAAEARLSARMTAAQVQSMGGTDTTSEIFAVMMAYLKMVQREAREDRKLQRSGQKTSLSSKATKIELEKQKIGESKSEAGQRYDHAMDAANKEMALGVASGGLTIAGAAAQFTDARSRAQQIAQRLTAPTPTPFTAPKAPTVKFR